MSNFFRWIVKVCVSGCIAFVILTGFCFVYYNVPVHFENDDGATDYIWENNTFYSRGTEGFAWGKTNNEGYINTYDYLESTDIDILVMGSSHMEAYQVAMDESTSAVLGRLLPDYNIYNIGISGHDFMVCGQNLPFAIEKYKPSEYVVIETSSLCFTDEQLKAVINGTIPEISSHTVGIIGELQKNPFLRLIYSQVQSYINNSDGTSSNGIQKNIGSAELYNEYLQMLKNEVSKSGAQLIVVYHPTLLINEDGGIDVIGDTEKCDYFDEICESNGVEFLDMSDCFVSNYMEKHILPHGFSNTSVGRGHLNKNGHFMIANSIYEYIKENE